MAETREEKLERLKQELTLVSVSLTNAKNQLNSGKVVKADELKGLLNSQKQLKAEIARLESGEPEESPAEPPVPPAKKTVDLYDGDGIPPHLRVKRPYTMSAAAIRQRREAATSKEHSDAMKGNKNAWRHGQYAEGFIRQSVAPCKTTCEHYETCEWVREGETTAGGACLDRAADFLKVLGAVQTAMDTGNLDAFKDAAAVRIAGAMDIVEMLVADIKMDGTLMKSDIFNKDGDLLGQKIVNHPSLKPLADLLDVLELTPSQFMITPLIVKKTKNDEKAAETLASMMGRAGAALKKAKKREEPGD